jgi:hypothetical protein
MTPKLDTSEKLVTRLLKFLVNYTVYDDSGDGREGSTGESGIGDEIRSKKRQKTTDLCQKHAQPETSLSQSHGFNETLTTTRTRTERMSDIDQKRGEPSSASQKSFKMEVDDGGDIMTMSQV